MRTRLPAFDRIATETERTDGVRRRTVLKTVAGVTAGALVASVPVAGEEMESGDGQGTAASRRVDRSRGFDVEVLAKHATFPDTVTATFQTQYDTGETVVSNLPDDASNVLVARVNWAPKGTSGWHTHPGPVVVTVVEGELEVVNERDCVSRRYAAGEAFVDPGHPNVHIASNPSSTDDAMAYATFFGVPAGESPTIMVPVVTTCRPVRTRGRRIR